MSSHPHSHQPTAGSRLLVALVLTLLILAVEVSVALVANSLALLSDAGHILTDIFALGIAWLALKRSERPPDARFTFGYRRTEILAALINAGLLIVITVVIAFEAISRLNHVPSIQGVPVVVAALVAAAINTYIAAALHKESGHNINIQAALLHVAGDIAASLGVAVAALVIVFTHAYALDPILSLLIALLIAVGAIRIVTQTSDILMEATPEGVDVSRVARAMQEIPGVEGVHDLHVWSLSDGFRLLSAHVSVPDQPLSTTSTLMSDLRMLLSRRFDIQHSTIEIECQDCGLPVSRPITMRSDGPEP